MTHPDSIRADLSNAALYGSGVFTTVAIIRGKPLLWEKHWRRLAANALSIGLDTSDFDEPFVSGALREVIEKNQVVNGRARITFFDGSESVLWSEKDEKKCVISIITGEPRKKPEVLKLTVSPYRLNSASPLAGVKSCNYLENILALNEARRRGYHEAIRLNQREEIAGGCMSNVFWLRGGVLHTPNLATGCLSGTTREFVMEKLACIETAATVDSLRQADAIYLTSAGFGITQVSVFEERRFDAGSQAIEAIWPR